MSNEVSVGVDWGTHSSKLCITSGRKCIDAPLFSSDMVATKGTILFGATIHDKAEIIRGLKGDLIKSSLAAPFWSKEDRLDTCTSLGEAVAFGLACLIGKA